MKARELGLHYVHEHVGYEPSGRAFNEHVLSREGLPHNPFINAGAIMVSSLIEPGREPAERFETIKNYLHDMSGDVGSIGFDNSVYLSEQFHADRNRSLAYYMRESNAFPPQTDINDTLSLYFQSCSITVTCETMASVAATLANNGICVTTNKRIVRDDIVRDTLSLMYMCGMYDSSGKFAFEIGLPAKSGVSGCIYAVVPNMFGVCIWSPRLDEHGNSVRGIAFLKQLVQKIDCHIFHNVVKSDSLITNKDMQIYSLISACARGDLETVDRIAMNISIHNKDYDHRTPLHLACAEGHKNVIMYLFEQNADTHALDRWNRSPRDELRDAIASNKATPDMMQLLDKGS